jgi:phosphoglycolate phosphatase
MADRALVFDLDGTLIDSDADIAAAANAARASCGLTPLPVEAVAAGIGWGLTHLLSAILPGVTAAAFAAARETFVDHYRAHPLVHTRALPGAERVLASWDGPLGLVTNKPAVFVEPILAGLGWSGRFGAVVAGDTLSARKPEAAPLLHALERLGCPPQEALFVGDSEVDAATAAAAGVPFACVAWGRAAGAGALGRLDDLLAERRESAAWTRPPAPAVWAHRGSHRGRGGDPWAPLENTRAAFARALAEGAAGIELDVWASADGVAAVIHDERLGRLTGGADDRAVPALPWAALDAVSLVADGRVPSLVEVLSDVDGRVPVNVELKHAAAAGPALAALASYGGPVVVSSFEASALAEVALRSPTTPRAALSYPGVGPEALAAAWALPGVVAWHAPAEGLAAETVAAARAAGCVVRAWTVNSVAEARRLRAIGVEAVLSDHPGRLRWALEGRRT